MKQFTAAGWTLPDPLEVCIAGYNRMNYPQGQQEYVSVGEQAVAWQKRLAKKARI